MSEQQTYTFQAEIQQLLNILVHSLYTEREIFLRELLSNASDALNRFQFEMLTSGDDAVIDPDTELAITVEAKKDEGVLIISDTGIGMNRDELIENLGTIAQSGAASFIRRMKNQQGIQAADLIGQFGVGFYSVFMVADKVEVTTRSFRPDDEAWTWISDGSTTYTIEPADKTTRGTTIIVYLKEDAKNFLEPYELRAIVRRHSDFIPFPIQIEGQAANQQTAIWRRPARDLTDEDYNGFYKQLTLDYREPLLHLHIVSDAPVQFYSVLFVPSKADRDIFAARRDFGLKLYTRKILIQEYNKDFLPNYLRFVDGVVDSEDLPLNVARESIQATRSIKRIGQSIKGKLLSELERLAQNDPDKYMTFWTEYGAFLKEGIATEPEDTNRLAKLLRFHSTLSGDQPTVSLADYVGRMKDNQQEIYFILAADLKSVAHSPHLDRFRSLDLEVLYLLDTVDSFMLMNLKEYEGRTLVNVDTASLDLPDVPEEEQVGEALDDDDWERIRNRFVDVLGERIVEVRESKVLTDNPIRLASPEGQMDRNVQRVYRMLEKEFEVPRKILELNRHHPLLHNMSLMLAVEPDMVDEVIEQLYENALLVDGIHPNPADMVPRIQKLLEIATRRS